MRRAAGRRDAVPCGAPSTRDDFAPFPGRLHDEYVLRGAGGFLDRLARGRAADLFLGHEHERDR